MVLMLIIGDLGNGKNILATKLAINFRDMGTDVESSYKINYKDIQMLNLKKFIDFNFKDEKQHLVILDEAYLLADSRSSMTKQNRIVSRVIFQSRKRHFDIIVIAQLGGSFDLRGRYLARALIEALEPNEEGFHYKITTRKICDYWKITYEEAKKFWDLYNTDEIVDYEKELKGA